MRSLIAAVFLLVVACAVPVRAQSQGGGITGAITDRLGGAVADAIVQVSGEDPGTLQQGWTDPALVRERNLRSSSFNAVRMTESPRILRWDSA